MRLYKIILFFVLLIGITSCKKDIEVSPNSTFEGQLFIESILIPGKLPRLFLSNSLPFFDSNVTPQEVFARGASAIISSNSLTDFLAPDSTFDKFRCRWVPFYKGSFPSQSGQTYDLLVTYRGKTYTATTTIDQPQVRIESVEYIEEFFDIYGGHDGVRIKFLDAPGPGNFYRFQMNRMMDKTRLHAHVLDVIKSDCTQDGEKFLTTDLGRIIFSDILPDTVSYFDPNAVYYNEAMTKRTLERIVNHTHKQWQVRYLAELLHDDYAPVRYVAGRAIRKHPGMQDTKYDFVATADARSQSRQEILERSSSKNMHENLTPEAQRRLLFDSNTSAVQQQTIERLVRKRNNRPVDLPE